MRKSFITVVVVEDSKKFVKLIVQEIKWLFRGNVQILVAKTFKEAKDIINQGLGEIFFIDFGLPDGHGVDLIELIREKEIEYPIIVQTDNNDRDYKLEIYDKYDNIKYLTKDELFEKLPKRLVKAKIDVERALENRIAIRGKKIIDTISADELCYVMSIPESHHLYVELYSIETKAYYNVEIKNMNLDQFMKEYNAHGIFLRCERSFIVNIKMVKSVFKNDNEILLIPKKKDKKGESKKEVRISIGGTYKKKVLARLKGLY